MAVRREDVLEVLSSYRIIRGSGVYEPLRAVDVVGIADAIMEAKPTAPVEASGSERVSDAIRAKYEKVKATTYNAGTDAERMKDGRLQGLNDAIAIAMVTEDRLAALRPQPSGETRERARSVERIKGWLERNPQGGAEPIHPDDLRALI